MNQIYELPSFTLVLQCGRANAIPRVLKAVLPDVRSAAPPVPAAQHISEVALLGFEHGPALVVRSPPIPTRTLTTITWTRTQHHTHTTHTHDTHTRHTHTHTHSCAPFNSRCLLADALLCVLRQVCLPADDIAVYNVPVAHHPGGGDGLVCFTRVPQTISTRRGYHRPSNVKGAWREFSPAKLVPFRSPLNGWRGAMFRSQRPVWVLDGGSTALPRVLDFLLPPPRKPCVIGDAKRAMPPDVCPVTCFTPFSGGGAALAYAHDGRVLLSDMPDPDTTWLHGATSVRRVPIGRTVHHLAYLDAMSGGSRDIVNPLYAVATSTRVRDHA